MFKIGITKRFLITLMISIIALALLPEKFARAEDQDAGFAPAAGGKASPFPIKHWNRDGAFIENDANHKPHRSFPCPAC